MSRSIGAAGIAFLLVVSFVAPAAAAGDGAERGWLDELVLVELDTEDEAALRSALALISSVGGRIGVVSPPSLLLGWIPYDAHGDLIGRSGIRDIYTSEALPGDVAVDDAQSRHTVAFFNAVARGEYQEKLARGMGAAPAQWPDTRRGDGILREEPLDKESYLQNLTANGFDLRQLEDRGLLLYGNNSDKMTGTSTVTLLFVESDGTGADPNTYTWTDAHVQDYIDGVNAGLLWWSDQTNNYAGCWAAFFVRYFPPTDARCQQWREMVLHSSADVAAMASEIMGNFGYTSGTHLARTDAFNTAQRATYGTDWAYTAFVAYNPPPAPDRLTDNTSAFAYFYGPYTFLLYQSFGWPVDQVFTHETGHIYGACDEYLDSGCSCAAVCSHQGVVNGNCATCSGGACMMKANSFVVCQYTDDHLGWQTNPCAPAPLTPPTANAVFPASGLQGTEVEVTISGSDFLYGAFATLGAGVTIEGTTLVGADTLVLTVQIDNAAVPGARDVTVKNRDLQADVLPGAFTVVQSTRHYVSPSGGNSFPYLTPADAAPTLASAIGAAGDGDSVLVETTTLTAASVTVTSDIWLVGAWNPSFTSRDLESGKTTLHLSKDVNFLGTGGGGMDGFVVENGLGTFASSPQTGTYGGAVRLDLATATVRNCELRDCTADYGGAISAVNSALTAENCTISGNAASRGGGVYLYGSTAALAGNTIVDNSAAQGGGTHEGAGVYIEASNGVAMAGNTVAGNTGATHGGGVAVRNSTAVSMDGGSVTGHTVPSNGGGIYVVASEVAANGVEFERNSGLIGGAAAISDASDATFSDCKFAWNTALAGGSVYASTGVLAALHNLFVGNIATAGGAGILAAGLAGGEIAGNTMDRNAALSGAGAMGLSNCAVDTVANNVITNTTSTAIDCAGTPPVLVYNDVWNTDGSDYVGCSPGVGSISADPIFADTSACDYRLGPHSSAIDAGRLGGAYADPDGSRGDMGRYGSRAFAMEQPSYPKNLAAQLDAGHVVLAWDANPEGDVALYAVYCDTVAGFAPGVSTFLQFVAAPDTSVDLGAPGDTAYYRIAAVDTSGYASGYSNEASIGPATAVGDDVSYRNRLYQNVPNPFNPTTTIRFELAAAGDVSLVVYDVAGRVVRRLAAGRAGPGLHAVGWDGRNESGRLVSSGVYFYRLTTGAFTHTRKMVMLK